MAFSTANAGNNAGGGAGAATQGAELPVIQTEGIGFLTLAGEARLRLTSQWSPPPAPTASLLSIASRKGLVAAAGPDAIIIASTESVRKAFEKPQEGDDEVRSFEPQLKLPLPIRICQLAFTAEENYLILSAEQGGGLAVYETQALQQGSTQSAFEIPTNGESLRALIPNPSPDKGELCAVVTNEGKLLMANMKERSFAPGQNGQVLREQVSCAAWSTKGKQLVAGLGDGTIVQLTPEGVVKAEIPRPPSLDTSYFAESLVWLENDLFLAFHISTAQQPPDTKCHIITRQGQNFQFQPLTNPVDPFGSDKTPHHTVARLKDFPPNLQDVLIFCSTAFSDIGLATRSKKALASDFPEEEITNVFTTTELADDSRRASLPMGDGLDSPVSIGTALDLSAKDKVYRPIPSDEQDESPGPLPGYWALNEEGVLSVWCLVYCESIRGGTTYPGLAVVEGNAPASTAATTSQTKPNPFSTSTSQTTKPNPFAAPATSAFGSSSQSQSQGSAPAFGGPSVIGAKASPWATAATGGSSGGSAFGSSAFGASASSSAPAFGKPSFGAPSAPAFGQSSGIGARASPWASAAASSNSGQSPFANLASGSGSAFGSPSSGSAPSSGGFASFANKGGFAQIGSSTSADKPSIFATTSKSVAPEVSMDSEPSTAFPPKASPATKNVFGAQPFKLQSTFQRDPNAKDEDDDDDGGVKDKASGGSKSMFGSTFGSALGEASSQPAKPNPFATASNSVFGQPSASAKAESTTPTATPAANKFFAQGSANAKTTGPFGMPSKDTTTPASSFTSVSAHTPAEEPPRATSEAETPKPSENAPDVPVPPESTSKATYPFGDSSSSSGSSAGQPENIPSSPPKGASSESPSAVANDAPLPPDPVNVSKSSDDAPLPPDPVKNKKAYDVEIPPLPNTVAKSKPAGDAPLPPDPVKQPKAYDAKFLSVLPGSKPTASSVLPSPKASDKPFVFPSNPVPALSDSDDDDDDDEEGDEDELSEEGTEAATEGSGVDVAKDLSPSITGDNKTPGFTPTSSFDGGLAGSYSTISRPDHERRGLFGEVTRNAPVFARPNAVSPRSPSPVRNTLPSKLPGKENEQPRSFATPAMASHLLGGARGQQGARGALLASKTAAAEEQLLEQQRRAKARKQAEESQVLVDEDDEAIQQLLHAPVEPVLTLDEFIAHSGATAPAGDSIPAQVEAVYRDINSMIDTLGLNTRSLAAFIKGHEHFAQDTVTKDDLASPDEWTLGMIEDLTSLVERDLGDALHAAKVVDVGNKLERCAELQRELARDRNKQADLKRIIASRIDPEQIVANRSLPLSAEQAAQQNDLRREYARFTKLLTETEENLTLLKAKIVSAGGGGAAGKGGPVPTVEAVVRTITKMTTMVEKRSGDIDVLENQMRKLRMGSAGASGSRESSPLGPPATPNNKRLSSSMAVFSPERSVREGGTPQRQHNHRSSMLRHSLSGSVALGGGGGPATPRTPPRKKLSGFGDLERAAVREKRERRAAVLGKLRGSLQNKGVSVWAVEDVE